ncbi:MAG TPA: DUF5715 family protein, partial [bacterium]|nr:DUF5715 family protein [bacterium]
MTGVQSKSVVAVALLLALAVPQQAHAQSLRGSLASISRMYRQALRERLPFYETSAGVQNAVRKGRLVRLRRTSGVTYEKVRWPYVQGETRVFAERLGLQYRAACGERLVITSAVRPATRQPSNATRRSVHPTGMAIDLRKPKGACLRWLRSTLIELERDGVIEATEEYGPPHFHVALFPTPYENYLAGRNGRDVIADGR